LYYVLLSHHHCTVFLVVADTVGYIRIFSTLLFYVFFFYVYELRLSAIMLLNEYDDDDDDLDQDTDLPQILTECS